MDKSQNQSKIVFFLQIFLLVVLFILLSKYYQMLPKYITKNVILFTVMQKIIVIKIVIKWQNNLKQFILHYIHITIFIIIILYTF